MKKESASKTLKWLAVIIPLTLIVALLLHTPTPHPQKKIDPPKASPPPPALNLANLGFLPDWSQLDRYQETISHATFLHRLETIYTKGDSWKKWITIDPDQKHATIGDLVLRFAQIDQPAPGAIFDWQSLTSLSKSRTLPLEGLHIAIDPGHIGGDFAEIEEREYIWNQTVIREGTMTLRTAQLLAPLLRHMGAQITLVRDKLEPVTHKRATDFRNPSLFYRTAEIRARAHLINYTIQPDLVICLHFNGSASVLPEFSQHFHVLLNGTYTEGELSHEDERFQMLQRLLAGTITEEIPLARQVAAACNDSLKLPAFSYSSKSRTSQNVDNHPNLWARNLLANRLYQCPVIFMEPYVMNSFRFITRFNENPEQIYLEYAHAVADGLTRYYSQK